MSGLRGGVVVLLALASMASAGWAQALVRAILPDCAAPGATVWLDVRVQLQANQTFKSYDIRIPYDPAQVTLLENQIQQGAWFQSGGSTFFWHSIIGNQLYVNGAILGPGLHVTGEGTVFRLPVVLLAPSLLDLQAGTHLLFDVNANQLPSLSIPAALQTPCTTFNLGIQSEDDGQTLRLSWDPQGWTQLYRIYGRSDWNQSWQEVGSTTSTTWTTPHVPPRSFYQVRAQFVTTP